MADLYVARAVDPDSAITPPPAPDAVRYARPEGTTMRRLILALTAGARPRRCRRRPWPRARVRVALGTTLNQLDPAKTTIGDEYIYVHLVFNGLSRIDPDMTVKPDLAESWTASRRPEDLDLQAARRREIPPRQRLRCRGRGRHRQAHPRSGDRLARPLQPRRWSRASRRPDPLTVKFKLNIPYAGFADIFADRQLRIVPKDKVGELSTQPVGTGPVHVQVLVARATGMELVKNPDYFETGLPKLDGVTMRIIPEAAARIAALESGAIDILWNLPYESVDKFKNQRHRPGRQRLDADLGRRDPQQRAAALQRRAGAPGARR